MTYRRFILVLALGIQYIGGIIHADIPRTEQGASRLLSFGPRQQFVPQQRVLPISSSLNGPTVKPIASEPSSPIPTNESAGTSGQTQTAKAGAQNRNVATSRVRPIPIKIYPVSSTQSGSSDDVPSQFRSSGSNDSAASQKRKGPVHVNRYFRKDGTPVRQHTRTLPDGIESNNFPAPNK